VPITAFLKFLVTLSVALPASWGLAIQLRKAKIIKQYL
jgi:hypothetical protein